MDLSKADVSMGDVVDEVGLKDGEAISWSRSCSSDSSGSGILAPDVMLSVTKEYDGWADAVCGGVSYAVPAPQLCHAGAAAAFLAGAAGGGGAGAPNDIAAEAPGAPP